MSRVSPKNMIGNIKLKTIFDIPFGNTNGCVLSLDALLPEAQSSPPVVLWLHGGGWHSGNKRKAIDKHMLDFLVHKGFALVSAEYRLSGEARFPAQIHDVKAAIRWLRAHPEVLGIDPDRIAIAGFSAGAHLAALAATTADVSQLEGECGSAGHSTRVRAASAMSAPTDFARNPAARDPSLNAAVPAGEVSPEERLLGGPVDQNPDLARLANPGAFIGPDTPPLMIVHGSCDEVVPVSQADYLYEALESGDTEVTFVRVEGGNHGCWPAGQPYPSKPLSTDLESWMLAFFEYYILEKPGFKGPGLFKIEASGFE